MSGYTGGPSADPQDPFLSSNKADHESAGVLRMLRNGMSAPQICKQLKISKEQLVHVMNLGLDDEAEASRTGVGIVDAGIPKGTQ